MTDTESSDDGNFYKKLNEERRKSRQSQESDSSSSPEDIPLLTQNKSRNECSSYLSSLDLAKPNNSLRFKKQKKINSCLEPSFNSLSLSNEIMDDLYESITSLDETEIEYKDRHKMNIDQFILFFDKYIYSTMCIIDDDLSIKNKEIIVRAIFEYICYSNCDQIQFKRFLNAIENLEKHQMINAINVYHARNNSNNDNNDNNEYNEYNGNNDESHIELQSIYEHSPLLITNNNDEQKLQYQSYEELNNLTENKIKLIKNIRNQFMNNYKNNDEEIRKTYIEYLWRWIEENGIPAIITSQNNNKEIKDMINNLDLENKKWRDIENKRYQKYESEIKSLNEIQRIKENIFDKEKNKIIKYIDDQINLFILFLIGFIIGYKIKRRYAKLLSFSSIGIVTISYFAQKTLSDHYYWKKISVILFGLLIGFILALKRN